MRLSLEGSLRQLQALLRRKRATPEEWRHWEQATMKLVASRPSSNPEQWAQLAAACSKAAVHTRNISRVLGKALRPALKHMEPQDAIDTILAQASCKVLHLATVDAAAACILRAAQAHSAGLDTLQLHHVVRWYKAHNLAGIPVCAAVSQSLLCRAVQLLSENRDPQQLPHLLLNAAALGRHCMALGVYDEALTGALVALLNTCLQRRVWLTISTAQQWSPPPPDRLLHALGSCVEYVAVHCCDGPTPHIQPHCVGMVPAADSAGAFQHDEQPALLPQQPPSGFAMLPSVHLADSTPPQQQHPSGRIHPLISAHSPPLPAEQRLEAIRCVRLACAALQQECTAQQAPVRLGSEARRRISAHCARALLLCQDTPPRESPIDTAPKAGYVPEALLVAAGGGKGGVECWRNVMPQQPASPSTTKQYMAQLLQELRDQLAVHATDLGVAQSQPSALPCDVDVFLPRWNTALQLDGPGAFCCDTYASLLTSAWTAAAVCQRALPTAQLLDFMAEQEEHPPKKIQGGGKGARTPHAASSQSAHHAAWRGQAPLSMAFPSWSSVLKGGSEQLLVTPPVEGGVQAEVQRMGTPPVPVSLPLLDQVRAMSRFCRTGATAAQGGAAVPYEALLNSIGMRFNPHAFIRHSFSGLLVKPIGGGSRRSSDPPSSQQQGPYLRGVFPLVLSPGSLLQQQLLLGAGLRVVRLPAWVWAARVAAGQDAMDAFMWSVLVPAIKNKQEGPSAV